MAKTLGQMIADIRSDLDRGTDFDARIQQAIANAIEFYKFRRYRFNTGRTTLQVSAERTSLSFDMLAVDDAVLQVDGQRIRQLVGRTTRWINAEKTDEDWTSEPVYYAIEDHTLRLFPPPDRTYSIEMWAHYDYTGISASTSDSASANPWLTGAWELIKSHAQAEVLEVYIKGDEALQQANVLKARAIGAERELRRGAGLVNQEAGIRPCM